MLTTNSSVFATRADVIARPAEVADQTDKQWLMLAVLLLGQFMGLLDVFVVNVALPTIGADLDASGASLQLVVGGYTVAYAMLLITGARLGDLHGRRRMYLLGVIVFTAASLACGLASSSVALIVFRFVQGAGAAVMVPQIMSVIQTQFNGTARATALSAYGVVLASGAVVGLILGGVLVNANLLGETWRPVFLVNVPLGILVALLVPRLVPADKPRATRRLDFAGLAIAVLAGCLFVLPVILGHELGWPLWTFACIAASVVLAGVFVRVEERIAAQGGDPLLNLAVLRAPGIASGLATLSCMQMSYGGFLFVFTLHLQAGLGYSALRAGLTYVPMAAAFGLVGIYWRKLPDAMHHALTPIGLALCAVAYLGIAATVQSGAGDGWLMWAALVVDGAGMGFAVSPLLTQALVRVPLSQAADASGLLTTAVQLGQVIGVAVFGTVFLSLKQQSPLIVSEQSHMSAAATSTTTYSLAVLAVIGLVAALALSRTVRSASETTARAGGR
jgi:EmrB/QacA subfamily drug resistance transporter